MSATTRPIVDKINRSYALGLSVQSVTITLFTFALLPIFLYGSFLVDQISPMPLSLRIGQIVFLLIYLIIGSRWVGKLHRYLLMRPEASRGPYLRVSKFFLPLTVLALLLANAVRYSFADFSIIIFFGFRSLACYLAFGLVPDCFKEKNEKRQRASK